MLASLAFSPGLRHGPPFGSERCRTPETDEARGAQPDLLLDYTWPAPDTFTDDSIARRTVLTCSTLGSQRIRLIMIRTGRSDDVIECDTKVCFLPEAGEYIAISYTWGCPVERCQIVVDKQPHLVTVNLWRFLWQARQLPELFSGWLWVDALSIEQSDPWEKLEQVKMITKIFGSARRAVVWLGPAYGNSDIAMWALAAQATMKLPQWRTPRNLWAYPVGTAILELCERPYWHRLWVYQELKASRPIVVLCGSRYIYFNSLERWLYNNKDERVKAKVQALQLSSAGKMSRLIRSSVPESLESALVATRYLLCTDPRDRVYAVLNFVNSGHEGIEADYTVSLIRLVNAVLRNMYASKERSLLAAPFLGFDCLMLEETFGMSRGSICMTKDEPSTTSHDLLEQFRAVERGHCLNDQTNTILQDMLGWCKRHNHRAIARMVSDHMSSFWGVHDRYLEEQITKQALDDDSEGDVETKLALREKIIAARKMFEDFASSP